MDFSKMSNEELKDTIKEINKELSKRNNRPKIKEINEINFDPLVKICKEYVDYCEGDDYYYENIFKQYIFETIIEAFYGEEFWEWFNKRY